MGIRRFREPQIFSAHRLADRSFNAPAEVHEASQLADRNPPKRCRKSYRRELIRRFAAVPADDGASKPTNRLATMFDVDSNKSVTLFGHDLIAGSLHDRRLEVA